MVTIMTCGSIQMIRTCSFRETMGEQTLRKTAERPGQPSSTNPLLSFTGYPLTTNFLIAFMVLNNRALASVAAARPQSPDDLLGVHGIGPRFMERYGEEVLKLVRTEVAHS